MTKVAIELRECSKIYKSKKLDDVVALNKFSYIFEYGKIYGIMGKSGAGKTTLLNLISMIDDISDGKILIDNISVDKLKISEKALKRNNDIGMIFQNYMLNEYMNSYENIVLPMLINKNVDRRNRKENVTKLINMVGLPDKLKRYPSELSGGEKQRIAIARALANDPKIILADEPTGNLDEENETYIFKLLRKFAEDGKCVIVVSHSNIIKKYADIIINIRKGELYVNK
ncbi:MAG: ABC transporter ATP-binding protein [Bacilli bacterium]|nr:ABC transporter ATP-binding protein [Bacilli bacterium]